MSIFSTIGGWFKSAGVYIKDVAIDIVTAFLPVLRSEAGKFVAEFKSHGIQIAIEAFKVGGTGLEKAKYFNEEMIKLLKAMGVTYKDSVLNLLREICVTELKERGII
jgi:hypothetical protein